MIAKIKDGKLILKAQDKNEEKEIGNWLWLYDTALIENVVELEFTTD